MKKLLVCPEFPDTFWSFTHALSFIGKKADRIIMELDDIYAAALRLGVFGKERFHYWHLIFWTLIRKPKLVSTAITLSIYGYHYRKICERYIY